MVLNAFSTTSKDIRKLMCQNQHHTNVTHGYCSRFYLLLLIKYLYCYLRKHGICAALQEIHHCFWLLSAQALTWKRKSLNIRTSCLSHIINCFTFSRLLWVDDHLRSLAQFPLRVNLKQKVKVRPSWEEWDKNLRTEVSVGRFWSEWRKQHTHTHTVHF